MQEAIKNLENSADMFIRIASEVKLSKQVYDEGWNAKEIIAHIVFYHEYYASVVKAIVEGQELPLIDESLAKVNAESAVEYSKFSREELLSRFKQAQTEFAANLLKLKSTDEIPYKKGGRIYKPLDYVNEIARHVMKHAKDLKREKRK